MASKVFKKIKCQTKNAVSPKQVPNPAYRKLLCNALILPHLDYGCSSWFPLLKKNLKLKLQKVQNKRIRFCLNLAPRSYIDLSHFRKKLPSGRWQSRILYCEYRFEVLEWNCTRIYSWNVLAFTLQI